MTLPRPIRDAALAISLLTVVPTGVRWPEDERTQVSGWLAAVGLVLGAVTAASVAFLPAHYLDARALAIAAIVVAVQQVFTRFLHLDGLADVSDALCGGHTPQRRLEIMKDSATGAFGTAAVVLAIALQVTALGELLESRAFVVLLVVPALGRLAATFAAWFGKPAREGGLGRSVMGRPSVLAELVMAATVVACGMAGWFGPGIGGLGFVAAGVLVSLLVPHMIARRTGGVTGDVMGASVVIVETTLYVLAALMTGVVGG